VEGEMSYSMQNGGGIVLGNMSVREVFRSRISSLNAGADPRKGRGARASPKAPLTFFTNAILHRCVLFYKFTDIAAMIFSRVVVVVVVGRKACTRRPNYIT